MKEWDTLYADGYDVIGTYPAFEKLIAQHVAQAHRVLELGTGLGPTIPLMLANGWEYHGIEGSPAAVRRLHEKYPELRERIVCGDFTVGMPSGFDLIVERASVAHNDTASIRRCLGLVWNALKPGGLFIACDWFSTWHSEFTRGEKLEAGTRTGYVDGQFKGVGKVHFSSEEELCDLFGAFEGIHLEERVTRRPGPNRLVPHPLRWRWISNDFLGVDYRSAVWDLVVRKPK